MKKLLLALFVFTASVYAVPNDLSRAENLVLSDLKKAGVLMAEVKDLIEETEDVLVSAAECFKQVIRAKGKKQVEKFKHIVMSVCYPRAKKIVANYNAIASQVYALETSSFDEISLAVPVIEKQLKVLKKDLEALLKEGKKLLAQAQALR